MCLLCQRGSFCIAEMRADKEFKKTLYRFKDDQLLKYKNEININIYNPQEHTPREECNDRTIEE